MAKKAKEWNNRLAAMRKKIFNKRATIRKAEGEKKQKLEQELAQMILDRETFKGLSSAIREAEGEKKQTLEQELAQLILDRKTFFRLSESTKKTSIRTIAVYPVVPNSPALPGWVQSVHTGHQVVLVGGLVGCLRCGWITSLMRHALKKPCDGRFRASKAKWRRLCQGRLPSELKKWPDELAAPTDVRPVDHLRYAGSEWVRGSQVAIALAFADTGRTFPSVSPRKVSWDPYPFPQA